MEDVSNAFRKVFDGLDLLRDSKINLELAYKW
jgi:hypothetical protein